MRQKPALPGFLTNLVALAYRGGGGGSSTPTQPPVYQPPQPPPPPQAPTNRAPYSRGTRGDIDLDTARANYIATQNYGEGQSYDTFGGDEAFVSWWKDNQSTTNYSDWSADEDLLYALAKSGNQDAAAILNYTANPEPEAPPAPDAPVTSPNGQTVTQPNPYTPPPPVSDRSSEVMQAGREARRSARKRRGLLGTLLAGETGGAKGTARTLLGQSGLTPGP